MSSFWILVWVYFVVEVSFVVLSRKIHLRKVEEEVAVLRTPGREEVVGPAPVPVGEAVGVPLLAEQAGEEVVPPSETSSSETLVTLHPHCPEHRHLIYVVTSHGGAHRLCDMCMYTCCH